MPAPPIISVSVILDGSKRSTRNALGRKNATGKWDSYYYARFAAERATAIDSRRAPVGLFRRGRADEKNIKLLLSYRNTLEPIISRIIIIITTKCRKDDETTSHQLLTSMTVARLAVDRFAATLRQAAPFTKASEKSRENRSRKLRNINRARD